jgi:hypothetical protein
MTDELDIRFCICGAATPPIEPGVRLYKTTAHKMGWRHLGSQHPQCPRCQKARTEYYRQLGQKAPRRKLPRRIEVAADLVQF